MAVQTLAGSSSSTDRLLHNEKLKLVGRLARALITIIKPYLSSSVACETSLGVRSIVALALLAARSHLPEQADCLLARNLARQLAPDSKLITDCTTFAQKLCPQWVASDWLGKSPQVTSATEELFKQHWAVNLLGDPLLLGWVDQYLKKKDVSGRSSHRAGMRAADILPSSVPGLTQWFTPDWIARLLVNETIDCQSDSLHHLRFIDPACGAGHILIPAMQSLLAGRNGPVAELCHCLENQLFGCDIDPDMIDLSGFAIYLAAREIAGSVALPLPHLYHFGKDTDRSVIGSLWLGPVDRPADLTVQGPRGIIHLSDSDLLAPFSAIATNPPFLSHRLIPPHLSSFLKVNYISGRFDLYTAFLSLCLHLLAKGGRLGVICQQSFMSITRYAALRNQLLTSCDINGLIQLGAGIFGLSSGEKTNNAIILASSSDKQKNNPVLCWRLLNPEDKRQAEKHGIKSVNSLAVPRADFATIGDASFTFWCPSELSELFKVYPPLESSETGVFLTNGLFTCNNALFVRHYKEVATDEAADWVPYDKGGGHKWYHTTPYLLNWADKGESIRRYRLEHGQSARLPGERYYFSPGVTYSYIGTKGFRARLLSPDSIFDIASSALFSKQIDLYYLLGFLNSSLVRFFLGVLNPTINFQIGDLRRLPFAAPTCDIKTTIIEATARAVKLAAAVEKFNPASPAFSSVALRGGQPAETTDLQSAYRRHCNYLSEINNDELECQTKIDQSIFELYQISSKDRALICQDPWVTRSTRLLAAPPSLQRWLFNRFSYQCHSL